MKRIIFLGACICLGYFNSNAQNADECEIYRLALDSLYNWTSVVTVDTGTANYPIDPQNPPKGENQKLVKLKVDYIICLNHFVPFNKHDITNWFANMINRPELLEKQNALVEREPICDFNKSNIFQNSNYCISVNSETYDTGDYVSEFVCSKKNGEKERKVDFNPSSLIFSKDGKTVYVYFLRKEGKDFGQSSRWAFVLKKTTGKWFISKMAGMPIE